MGSTKTEAEWRDTVVAMRQSGQSCARWCKEHGINPKTMGNWTRKFRLEAAADNQASFIELGAAAAQRMDVRREAAGPPGEGKVQVRCAVCTMSFPRSMDTDAVRGVLATMMAP
jgi:transposase-like protein